MSDLPPFEISGPAPAGWPYAPPPQLPPPPDKDHPASTHQPRHRKILAGVAAVAALSGLAGGVAGQLGAASLTSSAPAATRTAGNAPASFSSSATLSVGQVVARLEPSVVAVDVGYGRAGGRGAGTGVILTADGQVLTNAHVVAGATTVTVTLNGEGKARPARIIGASSTTDLALLQIDSARGLTPAPLGQSGTVRVGDEVVAIGNALALQGGPTVTKGIISGLDRSLDDGSGQLKGLLQTDASISSGNSGGPLINAAGSVIGINTAVATSSRSTSAENVGFAISIDAARPVIETLRSEISSSKLG